MNNSTTNRKSGILRRAEIALAFFAAAGIAGCAEAGSNDIAPPPAPAVAAASITVCNKTPDGCTSQTSFSLGTIRDLAIHVDWTNVAPGTRTQKLEFLDPSGGSYQVLNTSFVEEDASNGSAATDVAIPISGSMITQRGITGTWTVRVSLDEKIVVTQGIKLEP